MKHEVLSMCYLKKERKETYSELIILYEENHEDLSLHMNLTTTVTCHTTRLSIIIQYACVIIKFGIEPIKCYSR